MAMYKDAALSILPVVESDGSDIGARCHIEDMPEKPCGAAAALALAPPPAKATKVASMLSPEETYRYLVESACTRGEMSCLKTFIMGIFAGAYIGFGGFLGSAILTNCPSLMNENPGLGKLLFAVLFPVGLLMHTLHATELVTGNFMKFPAAIIEGKSGFRQLAKNWFFSWTGNLAGSLMLVGMMTGSGIFETNSTFPISNAMAKTSHTFGQVLIRAIMCNWLVCVAVWNTTAAQTVEGKVLGLWPPIACFVATGFEHCVANMYLIPQAMALGAPITVTRFLLHSLIPATLGNIIGGMVFVAISSSTFYGALGQGMPWLRARWATRHLAC